MHHGEHQWNQQIFDPQKNPKIEFDFGYVGTFVECCVVTLFSSNFWLVANVLVKFLKPRKWISFNGHTTTLALVIDLV